MSRTLGVAESKADIDDGTISGLTSFNTASTATVGFYGVTAITRPTAAAQAAVATTAATTGSAVYGFTSAQANGLVTLVNRIRTDLVNLGLITGS